MVFGQLILDIALIAYLIWFIPQLIHNFKRKSTEGISLNMHFILFLSYISDFIYGFGLHMQWQYRVVTCGGLLGLLIQHYQFYAYQLTKEKTSYIAISIILVMFTFFAFFAVYIYPLKQEVYDYIGLFTMITWWMFSIPQLVTNYQTKSAEGLSLFFIILMIVASFCDSIASWIFNWDYPSKIGFPLAVLQGGLLLMQFYWYKKRKPKQAWSQLENA